MDAFEPQIRALLSTITMAASVIGNLIGWEYSSSVVRARVALLRPSSARRPGGPAARTKDAAGEIVQCDLWFHPHDVPVWAGG